MDTHKKERLLVTGGSGFVGGHMASAARNTWTVFATFHTHPFSIRGVTPVSLDLRDKNHIQNMIRQVKPKVVIHCAAYSDVDACQKDPELAFRINTESARVLGEAAEAAGSRLIYVSSDMVFDGDRGDYKESDPTHPINIYGESKLAGEGEVKMSCSDAVIARTALVYGSSVHDGHSFSEQLIQRIKHGGTVSLFHDQFRTPILVQNLVEALLELAGIDFRGSIHLGGAERTDRYTFGLKLAELNGLSTDKIKPVSMDETPLPAPRPRDASFNISKAKSLLKTRFLGCQEGLQRY
jgi:dTDP-4-dehydrorhamnose reductase